MTFFLCGVIECDYNYLLIILRIILNFKAINDVHLTYYKAISITF